MNASRLDLTIDGGLAHRLGRVIANELYLADSMARVARRNPGRPSVVDLADLLGNWSRRHVEDLAPAVTRYGAPTGCDRSAPSRSRAWRDTRRGQEGLVRDLQELHLLTGDIECEWRRIACVAAEADDDGLYELAEDAIEDARRERDWMEVLIREATLEIRQPVMAAASAAVAVRSIAAPARPRWSVASSSLLRAVGRPLAAAVAIFLLGMLFMAAPHPWIGISLAPSACIIALAPGSRAARFYSVVMGHLLALSVGFGSVAFLRLAGLPGIAEAIQSGAGVPIARISASASGVLLLVFLMIHLRIDHPPAAGTLLAVTLGLARGPRDGVELAAGAILLAAFGTLLRHSRLRLPQRHRI